MPRRLHLSFALFDYILCLCVDVGKNYVLVIIVLLICGLNGEWLFDNALSLYPENKQKKKLK